MSEDALALRSSVAEIASEIDSRLETQRAEAHSRDREPKVQWWPFGLRPKEVADGQDGTVVPRTKGQTASAGRAGRAGRAGNLAH